MPTAMDRIKTQIKKLPVKQRAELVRFLVESLEEGELDFDQELARRVDEIKSGRARGTPAEHVFARLREKYS